MRRLNADGRKRIKRNQWQPGYHPISFQVGVNEMFRYTGAPENKELIINVACVLKPPAARGQRWTLPKNSSVD